MASLYFDDILPETSKVSTVADITHVSYDDDLAWIVEIFAQHILAAGGMLTRHLGDGHTITMASTGQATDRIKRRLEHTGSRAAVANSRHMRGIEPLIVWSGSDLDGCRIMSLPMEITATEQIVLTGVYNVGAAVTVETAERLAKRLYPMVNRYFGQWARHRAERRCTIEFDAMFNLSGVATAILDRGGCISRMNAAMRRLTATGDGLRCHDHDGALVATDLASAVRLQVAVRHALAGADDKPSGKSNALTLVCRRPNSPHGLIITVSAVISAQMETGDKIVIVHALLPDADLGRSVRPICALHGLSPTETSLVLHLVNGSPIDAVAKLMRIKPDTARSYLKQLFGKTATSRQVDLVRLILGSLLRLETQTLITV